MAQPGNFTPILLYGSSTPGNAPLAANLTNSATGSEIAINVADKNLFFKDSGGVVNTVPIRQSSTSSNGWLSSTDWNTFNNKAPAGAYVTAISIASSNGFTGTSSGGATPSLTLATSVTGLLKGNGTAVSAATSGTDYAPATSGTSILYGNGAGGFSNVTIGTGVSFAGGTLSATGLGGTVTSVAATVPSFLSISGSPITTSGTLAITLSGTALPVANGGTGLTALGPAFSAYSNANQTPATTTFTKVIFGVESFDTNSNFASSRFTPTVAGYYQISASVAMGADTLVTACGLVVYKNGSSSLANIGTFLSGFSSASYVIPTISGVIYMNGTTDYLEIYGRVDGTGVNRYFFLSQNDFPTVFNGVLVRSA